MDDRDTLVNYSWASKHQIKLLKGHPENDKSGADKLDSISITGCEVVGAQDIRTQDRIASKRARATKIRLDGTLLTESRSHFQYVPLFTH